MLVGPGRIAGLCGAACLALACSRATLFDDEIGRSGSGAGRTASAGPGSGTGATGPGSGTGATGPGSGTGATGPGSGTGGSGGCAKFEDCTNGIDDDCDGLTDCADPKCKAGFECTPAAPQGWQGPVAVYVGASPPPACAVSGGYLTLVSNAFDGLSAPPAMCPNCSCGEPKGVACDVATADFFENGQCQGFNGGDSLTIPSNLCQGFVDTVDPASAQWSSAPASGGICIAKAAGAPVLPPLGWAGYARLCGDEAHGLGCGDGLCVARPEPPFGMALCVAQDGDVPCPPGNYQQRTLFYQGANDTRGCTDCDCGAPSGVSCEGTVQLWIGDSCSQDEVTLKAVGDCAPLSPDPNPPPPPYKTLRSMRYNPAGSSGGSCDVVPGQPTGDATPDNPLTVCCFIGGK